MRGGSNIRWFGVGVAAVCVLAAGVAADDVGRPRLGIILGDAADGAVQIVTVLRGGPAFEAGLLSGDVLVRLDERAITSREQVAAVLAARRWGDRLRADVLRQGKPLQIEIGLATAAEPRRVSPAPRVSYAPRWRLGAGGLPGAVLVEVPDALRVHYGAPADRGVLISRVEQGSPAARAGFRVGDLLVTADGRPLKTRNDVLVSLLAAPVAQGDVTWVLFRDGEQRILRSEGFSTPPTRLESPEDADALRIEWLEREIERQKKRVAELERELESLRDDR